MNELEKIAALLAADGRQIKYGVLTNETADGLIAIRTGESQVTSAHMGDIQSVTYPNILVCVYHSDFLSGFKLMETLKATIKAAVKDTVHIVHTLDREAEYDSINKKYEFTSQFKIIKI